MFRCDFDVIESLESLEEFEESEHNQSLIQSRPRRSYAEPGLCCLHLHCTTRCILPRLSRSIRRLITTISCYSFSVAARRPQGPKPSASASLAVSCAVIVQYRKASPRAYLLGCRDAFGTALLPDKRFQFQYKKLVLASLVGNGVLSACVSDRQRERACLKFGENDGLEDGYYAAWLLQVFLPVRV